MSDRQGRRRRSSSLLIYKEPLESPERLSDQSVLPNLNATWVNAKGPKSSPLCHGAGHAWPLLLSPLPLTLGPRPSF